MGYDYVHRIVLNAYFRMGHDPGGFRLWWRALTGSDETLENAHLMRMAGRFSRRVRGYAKAQGIPVVDCPVGERKQQHREALVRYYQVHEPGWKARLVRLIVGGGQRRGARAGADAGA